MPLHFRSCCAALVMLGLLIISCGDDDPVGASSPCEDANTICINQQVTADDVQHTQNYSTFNDDTNHNLTWTLDGAISDYGPGKHIVITVRFDPPVIVRYSDMNAQLNVIAGPDGCYDRSATPTTTFNALSWTDVAGDAEILGDCGTGASWLNCVAIFVPIETGDELHSVSFEFTVPPTYTAGDFAGTSVLAADLSPITLNINVNTPGDTRGNPPAWPGEYPDDPAARAPGSPTVQ